MGAISRCDYEQYCESCGEHLQTGETTSRKPEESRRRPSKALSLSSKMPSQLDNVAEGKDAMKPHATAAGTDGGWTHVRPLRSRFATPTGIMSWDGESAWTSCA